MWTINAFSPTLCVLSHTARMPVSTRFVPKVVVRALNEKEVRDVIAVANRYGLPVTFRAAGTSLSGQASTDSILVLAGARLGKVRSAGRRPRHTYSNRYSRCAAEPDTQALRGKDRPGSGFGRFGNDRRHSSQQRQRYERYARKRVSDVAQRTYNIDGRHGSRYRARTSPGKTFSIRTRTLSHA